MILIWYFYWSVMSGCLDLITVLTVPKRHNDWLIYQSLSYYIYHFARKALTVTWSLDWEIYFNMDCSAQKLLQEGVNAHLCATYLRSDPIRSDPILIQDRIEAILEKARSNRIDCQSWFCHIQYFQSIFKILIDIKV